MHVVLSLFLRQIIKEVSVRNRQNFARHSRENNSTIPFAVFTAMEMTFQKKVHVALKYKIKLTDTFRLIPSSCGVTDWWCSVFKTQRERRVIVIKKYI